MFLRKLFYLNSALRRQKWSLDKLKEYQNRQLRYLITNVYKNNRFYHNLYKKNNVRISSIKTYEDLVKLPIVSKSDLQKYSLSFNKLNKGKYFQNTIFRHGNVRRTGGSTGKPLFVYFNNKEWDFSESIYARSLLNSGYKPTELLINSNPFLKPKSKWFNYAGFFRKKQLSMNLDVKVQLKKLYSLKENFTLYSYPTLLKIMSKSVDVSKLNLNRIITTGEVLSPKLRKTIENSFNVRVFNHYGTMEFNRIAWDCKEQTGMHVDMDSVAFELIKDGEQTRSGELGQTVITNLHNLDFPLIRYNQGDFAEFSSEHFSCGIGLPVIKNIIGRDNDFIVLKNNERISPIPLDVKLSHFRDILQYQIIQHSINKFELKLIAAESYSNTVESKISEMIKKLLKNENIVLTFNYVTEIKRSPGGKLRSVISQI